MVFIQKWNRRQFFFEKKLLNLWKIWFIGKYLRKIFYHVVPIFFLRAHSFSSSFFVFPFHYFPISVFSRFILLTFPISIFSDCDYLLQANITYWIFPSSISSKSWSMEVLLDVEPVLLSSECLEPSMKFLLFSSTFEPLSLNFQGTNNSRMKIVSKVLSLSNKYMWL